MINIDPFILYLIFLGLIVAYLLISTWIRMFVDWIKARKADKNIPQTVYYDESSAVNPESVQSSDQFNDHDAGNS